MSVEFGRGLLLLGVFHVHLMYASIDHLGSDLARQAQWQIKVLSPHVALFFALAGMTGRALPDKSWPAALHRSLMLLLVATFSHALGVLLLLGTGQSAGSGRAVLGALLRPIIDGTGHSTYVAWFFIVLAVVRLLAYALARGWRTASVVLVSAAAIVAGARWLGAADSFWDWRTWPAALLMFWLGTRIASGWRVPLAIGATGIVAALALPLVNDPSLLQQGPCWACHPAFVAQPTMGSYGVLPLYLAQEVAALFGLLWLAQRLAERPLGRLLGFIGHRSLQLLLLHGWVLLTFYGLMSHAPLRSAGPWLFVLLFALNVLLHLALYRVLRTPLDRFVALCARTSRRLVARAQRTVILTP